MPANPEPPVRDVQLLKRALTVVFSMLFGWILVTFAVPPVMQYVAAPALALVIEHSPSLQKHCKVDLPKIHCEGSW
jgi:hypothetical protein